MEPEVHIIEKYFQEILHCFTMTNIRCKGGKEIDLLAINPKTLERYHVESRVSTTFKLKLKATYSKKGRCYKNGIDYFAKEKFNHPLILEKTYEVFNTKDYNKVLIVWDVENKDIIEEAKKKYNIDVRSMKRVLSSLILPLMGKRHPKGSRDDVLRMLEFLALGFGITYQKQKEKEATHDSKT
jgi:hypothetical protein